MLPTLKIYVTEHDALMSWCQWSLYFHSRKWYWNVLTILRVLDGWIKPTFAHPALYPYHLHSLPGPIIDVMMLMRITFDFLSLHLSGPGCRWCGWRIGGTGPWFSLHSWCRGHFAWVLSVPLLLPLLCLTHLSSTHGQGCEKEKYFINALYLLIFIDAVVIWVYCIGCLHY